MKQAVRQTAYMTERFIFEPETKMKIGAVTYIVTAHFDGKRENLPEKIRRLLSLDIENQIVHLSNSSQ